MNDIIYETKNVNVKQKVQIIDNINSYYYHN